MDEPNRVSDSAVARLAARLGPPQSTNNRWTWRLPRLGESDPITIVLTRTAAGLALAQIIVPDGRYSRVSGVLLDDFQALAGFEAQIAPLCRPADGGYGPMIAG